MRLQSQGCQLRRLMWHASVQVLETPERYCVFMEKVEGLDLDSCVPQVFLRAVLDCTTSNPRTRPTKSSQFSVFLSARKGSFRANGGSRAEPCRCAGGSIPAYARLDWSQQCHSFVAPAWNGIPGATDTGSVEADASRQAVAGWRAIWLHVCSFPKACQWTHSQRPQGRKRHGGSAKPGLRESQPQQQTSQLASLVRKSFRSSSVWRSWSIPPKESKGQPTQSIERWWRCPESGKCEAHRFRHGSSAS